MTPQGLKHGVPFFYPEATWLDTMFNAWKDVSAAFSCFLFSSYSWVGY